MKFINFLCLLLILHLFISLSTSAQDKLIYSRVLLKADKADLFENLKQLGIYPDHMKATAKGYVVVFDEHELDLIETSNLPYEVLIEDMEKYQAKRFAAEMKDPVIQNMIRSKKDGFTLGNYAGYNNIGQLYQKMIEISTNYPHIAAEREIIGRTHNNRPIYMIKISDNPNTDESATEPVVYYDAMHHAREPLSMMTTLYYMFWLVENYGIDSTATHLINNRELYFVPLVNPDGYAHNIATSPTGGFWRKTRTPDPYGGDCIGTDPNRNYDIDWYFNGSTDACSQVFRGTSPFSEPCTQAIRDFVLSINPVMAFSSHSYGEIYLEAGLHNNGQEHYYADYSLDLCSTKQFRYATVTAGGLTMQYLNSIGAIAWLPEIGDEFYVPAAQIIPYAEKHLPSFIYLAQIAGEYPDIKQVLINQGGDILPGGSYTIEVELFNKGKTLAAENVHVSITNTSSNVSIVNGTASVEPIQARQLGGSTAEAPLQISVSNTANAGEVIEVNIAVTANGIEYENETQKWIVGAQNVLFYEDGSNGLNALNSYYDDDFNFSYWGTTNIMSRSDSYCFADSEYGDNYNSHSYLASAFPVNLNNTSQPVLEFWMAWGLSNSLGLTPSNLDASNCVVEVRVNNGEWEAVTTNDTQIINGEPRFVLNNAWSKQFVDLSPYIGSMLEFRYGMKASGNFSSIDGVFIDDIRIVDYKDNTALPVATIDGQANVSICQGAPFMLSHSSTNHTDFLWTTSNGISSTGNPALLTFNEVGSYTINLQVSNAAGFDTDSVTLIVNESTPVMFTSLPYKISIGETLSLSASLTGGTFSGTGVIFENFNPDIAGLGLHTLTYTYTNSYNCLSETRTQILVYNIFYNFVNYELGIIEPKITPNSELVIYSDASENCAIRLFDLQGKLLLSQNLHLQHTIEYTGKRIFQNLDKGLYILSIQNQQGIFSKKILVE